MTVAEYDKCVDTYADSLYRFALKSLRNRDEANDIVQESFMRLWERCQEVISGKEKSYLFTIGHHLIIDRVRMDKRFVHSETMQAGAGNSNAQEYSNIGELLESYLDELPGIQRSLVMLRDYEGYSYQEIAEITHLSESQVKVYIFRARTALRKSIGNIENIL